MRREDVIEGISIINLTAKELANAQYGTLDAFRNPETFKLLTTDENSSLVAVQVGHLADSIKKVIDDSEALRETLEFAQRLEAKRKETAA